MNEWIDGSDANTVTVWSPWGEQKVMRADRRALLRKAQARMRRGDEGVAPKSLPENAFAEGSA